MANSDLPTVKLPSGETVPQLGQGTWHMGESGRARKDEVTALKLGLDLGMTLIDTAEMYGDGRSEALVGEAIAGRRDEVFLVTKVYPHHASRRAMLAACNHSLQRLRVEMIDLYLLHWPGEVPLDETVHAFEALQREGKIRQWGVSNFDLQQIESLHAIAGGAAAQTDQVLYHLGKRGIEWDLLPRLRRHRVPVMAYSPFDQGRLLRTRALLDFAQRQAMTPAQVAIAWLLARDGVIAIPKAGNRASLRENAAALAHPLTATQLQELDRLFPPPKAPSRLAMI
jgi:diketogulonate reductase-like aldo/keto reductase